MSQDQPPNDWVLRLRNPLSHKSDPQFEMLWISQYPQRNRALLWHGFEGNMGMIVDGLKATPCRKGDIERLSCHRRRYSMPGFVASALHELSPAIMRVYTVFGTQIAHIWHGMLTKQNNCRTANVVIERFYRQVCIPIILGRVPFLQHAKCPHVNSQR